MPLPEITVCPSTLRPGFTTYSPAAEAALFGSRSKKVSHILSFGASGSSDKSVLQYNEKVKKISISGVQEKFSLKLERNALILTDAGGTHILKPIPSERLSRVTELPANEHVSMQIAKQVFGIRTAECGMIFFDDGSPAYITRRFDYKTDGSGKYQLEDFAALMGKTPESEGNHFKYNASYLDMANLIRQYVAAAPAVLLDLFRRLVFNFLIGNGDAHLKNFALMETVQGDFILTPAYDLLCTTLHIDDSHLALQGGLYEHDYEEKTYHDSGMYTGTSFVVFAEKAGISAVLARQVVNEIVQRVPRAIDLVRRSFLREEAKDKYIEVLGLRRRMLSI